VHYSSLLQTDYGFDIYTLLICSLFLRLQYNLISVSCGEPLTNGGITRTTWDGNTVGMYANYTCSVGYENPTGSMSRLCEPDGIWSGDVASCSGNLEW
jgi:hypothetical protein